MSVDWKNGPFKPEDFQSIDDKSNSLIDMDIAERANARFKEVIEACPVVYKPCKTAPWYERPNVFDNDTHKARLIAIEELEK